MAKASRQSHEKKAQNLALRLMDARIDYAVKEYTLTMCDLEGADIEKLEKQLAEVSRNSAFPTFDYRRTIEQVSTARGNFKF